MDVELQTDGGFAYLPGLNRPVTIDLDQLNFADATEMARLVAEAGFFDLPARLDSTMSNAADARQYTLTVSDGERCHSVSFSDSSTDRRLVALRDFVRERASAR